jgi:hypothetical protein
MYAYLFTWADFWLTYGYSVRVHVAVSDVWISNILLSSCRGLGSEPRNLHVGNR